jgi:hypothetical protein
MSSYEYPQQTIKLAIDHSTGEIYSAEDLLLLPEVEFSAMRREAMSDRNERKKQHTDTARFRCAMCEKPLHLSRLKSGSQNRWFVHSSRSIECPWFEKNRLTAYQTKALIYRGQQEGAQHRALKQFIATWLEEDEFVSKVAQEKTTFGEVLKGEWRRPDVKCFYKGKPLVFEIQLSYTFLSDVIARDDFYKKEGIYIVWVFAQFDLKRAAITDEVFFNRRNLFVLDADAIKQTLGRQVLTFSGYHQTPKFEEQRIVDDWTVSSIGLNEVTFPVDTFRPYFFDYENELQKLEILKSERQAKILERNWLDGLQNYLDAAIQYYASAHSPESRASLLTLVDRLAGNSFWNIDFDTLREDQFFGYHSVLAVLLSIKFDKPVSYDVDSVYRVMEAGIRSGFRDIGQHAFAVLYLKAYRFYKPKMSSKHHAWLVDKANEIKKSIDEGNQKYRRFTGYDKAISLLFPELADVLKDDFGVFADLLTVK